MCKWAAIVTCSACGVLSAMRWMNAAGLGYGVVELTGCLVLLFTALCLVSLPLVFPDCPSTIHMSTLETLHTAD